MGGRERRWLILTEGGEHSWAGRATDPSDEEIAGMEEEFARRGLAGWLAVFDGAYWSAGTPVTLLPVRALAGPNAAFGEAAAAFRRKRDQRLSDSG